MNRESRGAQSGDPENGWGTQMERIPLLTVGFRPFFLAAGLYAALPMIAWLAWIAIHEAGGMVVATTISMPPHVWHAHEMVFGFASAAMAGFLLTAVPNWTGAPRLKGRALAALVALWAAGRLAMWVSAWTPALVVAAVDLAFLPVLGIVLARQLARDPAPRNVVLLSLLAVLAGANLVFHLDRLGLVDGIAAMAARIGLLTFALLIAMIGGRVVPNFTRNALMRRGLTDDAVLPRSFAPLNAAAIGGVALYLLASMIAAPAMLLGLLALAAALANGARMWFWQGARTLDEPIVWVLHLAYGWLAFGFALAAIAHLTGAIGVIASMHALGTGAVGTMTLAIMTRAALGHTGRPLVTPRPVVLAYGLVSLAGLLRALGPDLAPALYNDMLLAAGTAWTLAFALFSVVYYPILTGPRVPPRRPRPSD